MTPLEISAMNLRAIEEAEERLREVSTDWNLRMSLLQQEKAERDRYAYFIDGVKEARDQAMKEGMKDGLREGLKEGKREERRAALLQLLELRGVALTPDQRARIAACEDLDQLNTWFTQAVTCQSADELR